MVMHELSVTQGLVDTVLKSAKDNHADSVKSVSIVMGEYYDYVPEIIEEYFEVIAEDTVAADAKLYFKSVPVKIHCNRCNKDYSGKGISAIRCTACGAKEIQVLEGRELFIESMEIE